MCEPVPVEQLRRGPDIPKEDGGCKTYQVQEALYVVIHRRQVLFDSGGELIQLLCNAASVTSCSVSWQMSVSLSRHWMTCPHRSRIDTTGRACVMALYPRYLRHVISRFIV